MRDFIIFSSSAASSLISAIWQGTALVVSVALLLKLFPGLSAAARSLIWMMVLLLIVGLHIAPFMAGNAAVITTHLSDGPVHVDPRWSVAIAGVWLLLSFFRGGQLLLSGTSLRRIARRAVPLGAEAFPALPEDMRHAEICISEDVERPCVAGFFSPRILLPSTLLEKLSPADMEQIILHEMEHLRRIDDWTNLLQKISLVFFPLNPVLFWVERRLCVERELACDDSVMRATRARKAYAACLTNLAEHSMLRRGISLALGAWERQSELTRRVHRILAGSKDAMGSRQTKWVTGILASGLLCGTFALAHSPALISFAPALQAQAAAEMEPIAPPAQIVKTAYHEPLATPKLVKAELVSKPDAVRHRKRIASSPGEEVVARKTVRHSASWLVLTEWDESTTISPRPAVLLPSYAAVPTPDGWLIIQL